MFVARHFLAEQLGKFRQNPRVHPHALELHIHQRGQQRRFDFVEDAFLRFLFELRFEDRAKLPGDVRGFHRVLRLGRGLRVAEAQLGLAARSPTGRRRAVTEMNFRKKFQCVPQVRFDKGVRQHHVEQLPAHRKTVPLERAEGELEVVADLLDPLVFEQQTELAQRRGCLARVGRQRHEPARVGRYGKSETDQAGLLGIVTVGADRNGNSAVPAQRTDKFRASRSRCHTSIVVGDVGHAF